MTAFAQRMGKVPQNKKEYNDVNIDANQSGESSNFVLSFKPNQKKTSLDSSNRIATFNGENLLTSREISQSPTG